MDSPLDGLKNVFIVKVWTITHAAAVAVWFTAEARMLGMVC
jgi:hypothetical protein